MRLKLRMLKAVGALRAITVSGKFSLLDLPDELITLIIEQVDDLRTLQYLARTCNRLQDIAEAKVYRVRLMRSAHAAESLQRSLKRRSQRAKALQILDIPCNKDKRQDFNLIAEMLSSANNLKELMFESPYCNSCDIKSFEDAASWKLMTDTFFSCFQDATIRSSGALIAEKPLQRLQRCESHRLISALFDLSVF